LRLSSDSIEGLITRLEQEAKGIKDEIFRLSWYMRGGVSSEALFHIYSYEDRILINEIVKENIETTKKSGLPLI
jgi:hypothetical protein